MLFWYKKNEVCVDVILASVRILILSFSLVLVLFLTLIHLNTFNMPAVVGTVNCVIYII